MSGFRPRTWLTFPSVTGGPLERVAYEWRDTDPARFQACLARHHGKLPRPHCDCRANGRCLELSIKGRTDETGGAQRTVYHLACQAHEGPLHRPICPFHGASEGRPSDSGSRPAMRANEDGTVSVSVGVALGLTQASDASSDAEDVGNHRHSGAGGVRRNRLTLLGLLWAIWDRTSLAGWSSAQAKARFPRVLRQRLLATMAGFEANGVALSGAAEVILRNADCQPGLLRDLVTRNAGRSRILLIGRLTAAPSLAPTEYTPNRYRLVLEGASEIGLSVFVDGARLGNWAAMYPTAARLLDVTKGAEREAYVFVILTVTMRVFSPPSGPGRVIAEVQDFALMETSLEMVPVASAFELRVANDLVSAGRRFRKPLRYDPDAEPVHPDFVLTDTTPWMPMEVFGRTDEGYQTRKAEKVAYYDRVYGRSGWWSWEPACQAAPPPLPPVRGERNGVS